MNTVEYEYWFNKKTILRKIIINDRIILEAVNLIFSQPDSLLEILQMATCR